MADEQRIPDAEQRWITNVISPLLAALTTELRFLEMGYPTWRFEYDDLELIRPLQGIIPLNHWGDYMQFVQAFADRGLVEQMERHDAAVDQLRTACRGLQQELQRSSELALLYKQYTSPEMLAKLGTDLDHLFGARKADVHLAYLAQLIVNTTPDVKEIYLIRPLWNTYKDTFLKLLTHPGFRSRYKDQTDAMAMLQHNIGECSTWFISVRDELQKGNAGKV